MRGRYRVFPDAGPSLLRHGGLMRILAAALTAFVLAVPAAQADDFPANEDPHCAYVVPAKMRLKTVLRKGIPVRVTCDGAGEASSIATIQSRKQRDDWLDLHSGGVPGISNSDLLTFEEAGTQTLRVNIIPKKFFRRYAKTKFRVLLGVKRDPDKPYHTSVDSGQMITVIR
jgi:hypothetical protein